MKGPCSASLRAEGSLLRAKSAEEKDQAAEDTEVQGGEEGDFEEVIAHMRGDGCQDKVGASLLGKQTFT